MTSDVFKCEGKWVGDRSVVVTVEGELDLATSDYLRDMLSDFHAKGVTDHLVIDLTHCRFVDSAGLGVLVAAQRMAKAPLNVVATNKQVVEALELTSLDLMFLIHETREAALDSLRIVGPDL
jgi:anti-anti-sigma factor